MPFRSLINKGLKFLLFLFGLTSFYAKPLLAQLNTIKLISVFDIGKKVSASPEYLFRNPQSLVTDKKGRIYISDKGISQIKVYNKKGKFLYEFGKKGKGPGEFQEITTLSIKNDQLIIFDKYNQRFTKLSLDGKLIKSYNTDIENTGYIDISKIMPFRNSFLSIMITQFLNEDYTIRLLKQNFKLSDTKFAKAVKSGV